MSDIEPIIAPSHDEDYDDEREDGPSHINQDGYKVYKKRWLVLLAVLQFSMLMGIHRSVLTIIDILYKHWGTTVEMATRWSIVPSFASLMAHVPFGRLVDRFGIRKIAYFGTAMLLISHAMFAMINFGDDSYFSVPKPYRFPLSIMFGTINNVANAATAGFGAKVATSWFPKEESTLALVTPFATYTLSASVGSYLMPRLLTKESDLAYLSYIYLIFPVFIMISVIFFIRRSLPRIPPSAGASLSSASKVSLMTALKVVSIPSFMIAMIVSSVDGALGMVQQLMLQDILAKRGYPDTFCGQLVAQGHLVGFLGLFAGSYVEKSTDYVRSSRILGVIVSSMFVIFSMSLTIPGIPVYLMIINLIYSFLGFIMWPLRQQVILRRAVSVLPEASVVGLMTVIMTLLYMIAANGIVYLELLHIPLTPDYKYEAPMIIFSILSLVINVIYAISYREPTLQMFQDRLRRFEPPTDDSLTISDDSTEQMNSDRAMVK